MIFEVRLPQWGMDMREATVVNWYREPGDIVSEEEDLVEVETDKATEVVGAPVTGVLLEIVAAPGTVVEVGGLMARIEFSDDA